MSTKFFTNTEDKTVFQKFKGILENMKDIYAFHAVVGYFRSSGYFALQEYLKDIKDIKILVGINVDEMFAESQRKGLLYFGDETKTKHEFLNWFIQDLKDAKYSEEVENGILKFIEDLISGRIEVRAHNSKTLHAKFYLFLPEVHTEHSDGWVIMGSSNLTEAGLGIKKSPNYELNIALKDYDDVEFTKKEFNILWEQSTPILPADIKEFKKKTHIGQNYTPFEIYLKLLIEYFGKNIDYDPDTVGDLPKTYKKLSYQIDAVNQGFSMLMEHNGFFLSDVVGLGKTIVASMIAKRFMIANGSMNTKILVVYPPALEKNWKSTFRMFGLDKHTKFITNGSLDKIIKGDDLNYWLKEDYDLILVDEAHKYRNHASATFAQLQRICKAPRNGDGLVKGKNKKVMLISATPLNNRPQDLYYQLLLFQDARKSTLPVTNLQSFFGPIVREYRDIMKEDNPEIQRIRDMYNQIRERVISQITVRRTRRDLKNYPKYIDDLKEQGIVFPEIAPLKPVVYSLNSKLGKLFYQTIFYLTDEDKVNYFRYQAIRFLNQDDRDKYYEQAVLVSKSLAGIMKTLMVKRLESSFHSFKITLRNLMVSTERMIQMFENDKVLIAPDLNINELVEKGFSMEEIEELIEKISVENPRNNVFKAEDFDPDFLEGLKKDHSLLKDLYKQWSEIKEDPKLDELLKTFENELFNKEINPTGQLVIFTESNDTAEYLYEKLKDYDGKGVLKISSENRKKVFETIQKNFDANYIGERKDDYHILITTDVLAEGVNLHRANVLVNYDTPWNATRLMQRTGRINRIGSIAGVVYNYNFYPSQQGDEEIKLYKNALIKLQGFHSAFGEDAQVFTHEELVEQFELFKEGMPDEEDKRLKYLRFIREFKDANPIEFKRIKAFPMKARTARKNSNAKDDSLNNASLVFLKSPYKMEFYSVSAEKKVVPLTFIEAAEYFESNASELSGELPTSHFGQVQAALDEFDKEFFSSTDEGVTTTDKADAISAQAKKFLREQKGITRSEETKNACTELIELVDKGTFTPLPNEIRKMKRELDKRSITHGQVDNLIILLSKKYSLSSSETDSSDSQQEIDVNITPSIVITETFVP
ncbi:helicase-related protein [Fluviicola taffensis]|uniref:Helicase domain protein n=1 Tax=Fluviicola taffensis (strain DSM 16823 / NCIMB 13979 / RW262) TaxID=755732 RepID=F2IJW3_FLUTR|nr:helicase-related protein [Fluviicola taffensis]AEA45022.1 helicase domain protein [Fluviicola taffensis DSM 16823]